MLRAAISTLYARAAGSWAARAAAGCVTAGGQRQITGGAHRSSPLPRPPPGSTPPAAAAAMAPQPTTRAAGSSDEPPAVAAAAPGGAPPLAPALVALKRTPVSRLWTCAVAHPLRPVRVAALALVFAVMLARAARLYRR